MWRHPVLVILVSAYIGWGGWSWFTNRPVHPPDGILAATDPQQTDMTSDRPIRMGHWNLTARAHYLITARILARERYHFDSLAELIPEDLALGWGPMSDNRLLRTLDITQSDRFYFWHAQHLPFPKDVIINHSANTHVIPENPLVARELSKLRPGQVVTLSGELVDAVRDDGRWIKTSMVRDDTGAGACEVMLVSDVTILSR
jgi:hypothetical protein